MQNQILINSSKYLLMSVGTDQLFLNKSQISINTKLEYKKTYQIYIRLDWNKEIRLVM